MTKHQNMIRQSSLTLGLLLVCTAILVSSGSSTHAVKTQEDEPKVINNTEGFQVVNLVKDRDSYVLSLKNTYSKAINGYLIGTGPKSKLTVDLTVGDRVITTGEVTQEKIPISNLKNPATNTYKAITVLGVLFEDGTSEGNPQAILETKQRRKGMKLLLKRAIPLIESKLASPDGIDLAILNDLRAQISSLSDDTTRDQPPYLVMGTRNAKQDLLTMLQELEHNPAKLKEGLSKIKKQADNRVVRIKDEIQ